MSTDKETRSLADVRKAHATPAPDAVVRWPRIGRASLVAGVLAMLLVAAGGVAFALTMAPAERWTATGDVLIVPVPSGEEDDASSYFEVLSRGQVTETAAEIMTDGRFLDSVSEDLDIDPADVESEISVVPGTAVVAVSVTADERAVAEELVDRLISESMPTVNDLLSPFEVRKLGSAEDSATRSGLSRGQLAAAIGVLAVVIGVAVQQVTQHIMTARRQVVLQRT